MEFEELKNYVGEIMEVKTLNKKFKLTIEHDLAGDWAVWAEVVEGKKDEAELEGGDYIYATLNYEARCVPVQYQTADCDMVGSDVFEGEVTDFDEYRAIVSELVEKIFQHKEVEEDGV